MALAAVSEAYGLYESIGDTYDQVRPITEYVERGVKRVYDGAMKYGLHPKRRKLPPTKIMKLSGQSATNKLANRASMVRRNPLKVKSKKVKKIKVSNKLRKKINEVINAKKIYGEYNTVRMGTIGTGLLGTADTTNLAYGFLGMINQAANLFPVATTAFSNSKSMWQLPYSVNGTTGGIGGLSAGNFRVSDNWASFFHPMKFLDAASVLWNRKPISEDWTLNGLNFTSRVDASGGPVTDPATAQNLKIDIVNSYATFELKNNCKREMTVEIYHIYGKHKVSANTSLQSLIQSCNLDLGSNGPLMSNEAFPGVLLDINVKPGDIHSFKQNHKYETITIKIKPGETCKHSLQGPKNTVLDLGKLYAPNNVEGLSQLPKQTVSVLMCVYGDLQTTEPRDPAPYADAYKTGHFIPRMSATDSYLRDPIAVKWTECFKLRIPEMAGFVSRALPAVGSGVPLTTRRPVKAFADFAQVNLSVDAVYAAPDEEQPAATIPESPTY